MSLRLPSLNPYILFLGITGQLEYSIQTYSFFNTFWWTYKLKAHFPIVNPQFHILYSSLHTLQPTRLPLSSPITPYYKSQAPHPVHVSTQQTSSSPHPASRIHNNYPPKTQRIAPNQNSNTTWHFFPWDKPMQYSPKFKPHLGTPRHQLGAASLQLSTLRIKLQMPEKRSL